MEDIKLLTFFMAAQDRPMLKEHGKDWRLRTYQSLLDLVPLTPPDGAARLERACECRWSECPDYPTDDDREHSRSTVGTPVPAGTPKRSDTSVEATGKSACAASWPVESEPENVRRTKIGGYPSHIQSELWWDLEDHPANPKFCWQIDSEEKVGLAWGDHGMVYFARGTAAGCSEQWFLDWQSY